MSGREYRLLKLIRSRRTRKSRSRSYASAQRAIASSIEYTPWEMGNPRRRRKKSKAKRRNAPISKSDRRALSRILRSHTPGRKPKRHRRR
jgi:hypothetical protein